MPARLQTARAKHQATRLSAQMLDVRQGDDKVVLGLPVCALLLEGVSGERLACAAQVLLQEFALSAEVGRRAVCARPAVARDERQAGARASASQVCER